MGVLPLKYYWLFLRTKLLQMKSNTIKTLRKYKQNFKNSALNNKLLFLLFSKKYMFPLIYHPFNHFLSLLFRLFSIPIYTISCIKNKINQNYFIYLPNCTHSTSHFPSTHLLCVQPYQYNFKCFNVPKTFLGPRNM